MKRNVDSDNQSLRGFLRLAETEYPEELLRVREPIDLRFDATALVPILPPAPGRLSTMKGCPMDFAIRSSRMRMTTSLALPPAKGTMTWMGRVG